MLRVGDPYTQTENVLHDLQDLPVQSARCHARFEFNIKGKRRLTGGHGDMAQERSRCRLPRADYPQAVAPQFDSPARDHRAQGFSNAVHKHPKFDAATGIGRYSMNQLESASAALAVTAPPGVGRL